jgi:hypothetical protein
MPTIAHCQERARELTALAEREPQHRAQHLADTAAWPRLASRMVEMAVLSAPYPRVRAVREHQAGMVRGDAL